MNAHALKKQTKNPPPLKGSLNEGAALNLSGINVNNNTLLHHSRKYVISY